MKISWPCHQYKSGRSQQSILVMTSYHCSTIIAQQLLAQSYLVQSYRNFINDAIRHTIQIWTRILTTKNTATLKWLFVVEQGILQVMMVTQHHFLSQLFKMLILFVASSSYKSWSKNVSKILKILKPNNKAVYPFFKPPQTPITGLYFESTHPIFEAKKKLTNKSDSFSNK